MKYKILDLFSGAGGFSKGFDMIDEFETVLATDFNQPALETFQSNFPDALTICGDITDKKIKNEILEKSRELSVNMIIGGPPCQGFSNKGKKLGLGDPRNFLFLEYLDIVKHLNPEIFIIENVKAMMNASDGYFMNEIKKKISELGYFLDYGVLTASDFGVPQKRERTIIIASRRRKYYLPKKGTGPVVTVRDAIFDLAYLNSGEGEFESTYRFNAMSDYQEFLRKYSKNKLFNHIATNHSSVALEKLKMIPAEKGKEYLPESMHGKQKFKTTWGRLKWDEPSPTIDTRFDTPSNGRNSHPFLDRSITPREAARLQSFPDDFVFIGKKTQITKQIGNAVPPLLALAIAKSIIRQECIDGNQ